MNAKYIKIAQGGVKTRGGRGHGKCWQLLSSTMIVCVVVYSVIGDAREVGESSEHGDNTRLGVVLELLGSDSRACFQYDIFIFVVVKEIVVVVVVHVY